MATNIVINVAEDDLLAQLLERLDTMQQAITDLTAAVAHNSTVTASAATLIQGLADQLEQAAGDEAAVMALASDVRTAADSLAAAVSENTPAAEEPTEPAQEEPTA